MSKQPSWNYELIAAMSAVFIGACALLVSILQTRMMLQQNSASIWPSVSWGLSVNIDGTKGMGNFELYAENKGVGPAIIEHVALLYKNKTFPEDSIINITFDKIISFSQKDNTMLIRQASLNGSILASNERKYLFHAEIRNGGDSLAQQFLQAMYRKDLDIMICYSDVYKRRWIVRDQNKVTKTRKCL